MEAAKKLANEPELCKTVKKKRRRNCLDAMHKLQQIEDEMNQYRIKMGKKPTLRASVIIAGSGAGQPGLVLECLFSCQHLRLVFPFTDELNRSDCGSLSSLPTDDGEQGGTYAAVFSL